MAYFWEQYEYLPWHTIKYTLFFKVTLVWKCEMFAKNRLFFLIKSVTVSNDNKYCDFNNIFLFFRLVLTIFQTTKNCLVYPQNLKQTTSFSNINSLILCRI